MCLGVPGKIVDVYEKNGLKMAKVDFGGGTHVVPGVYVYIFEMESDSESSIVETGDVTVIR